MASINYAAKEISVKIVYYGPGLSGKTTNLQVIHRKTPPTSRSDMVSLATETDRTLFFDFLPIDLGTIKGFATKFQLYTVPGQVYYNATRKLVLRGVDGVVFVADSAADKMQENIESFQNLEDNLAEYGYKRENIPIVLQFNKRDLPNALPVEEIDRIINKYNLPWNEAIAFKGKGIFESLKMIGKLVIDSLNRKYNTSSIGSPLGTRPGTAAQAAQQSPGQAPPPPGMPQAASPPPRPAPPPPPPPQPQAPAGGMDDPFAPPMQNPAPQQPAPQAPQQQAPQQSSDPMSYGSISFDPMDQPQGGATQGQQSAGQFDAEMAQYQQELGGGQPPQQAPPQQQYQQPQQQTPPQQQWQQQQPQQQQYQQPQQQYQQPQQQWQQAPQQAPQQPQQQQWQQQQWQQQQPQQYQQQPQQPQQWQQPQQQAPQQQAPQQQWQQQQPQQQQYEQPQQYQQPQQQQFGQQGGDGDVFDDTMYFTSVNTDRPRKKVKRPVNPKNAQKGFLGKLFNRDS